MSWAMQKSESAHAPQWPQWPVASPLTRRLVGEALDSTKWTPSGQSRTGGRFDREISERWAEYIGVRHALTCASGTAGLNIALEALGIGPGDEVIVPGMTWVACPQTVYNAGAVPILVDIDPETLCLAPSAVRAAITARTRAIMLVHAYCSVADLDALVEISSSSGIPLIEDCSQAHGAAWRGRRVGSFGKVSVFSTHQSKLLTSAEGGLVCTNDADLHSKMLQARSDGRRYTGQVSPANWMTFAADGTVQGRNFVMSELGAALLVGGLAELDAQLARRSENFAELARCLAEVGGVEPISCPDQVTNRVVWRLVLRLDLNEFGGANLEQVGRAVSEELDLPVEPVDAPFSRNRLYQPLRVVRVARRADAAEFDLNVRAAARLKCGSINPSLSRITSQPHMTAIPARRIEKSISLPDRHTSSRAGRPGLTVQRPKSRHSGLKGPSCLSSMGKGQR
jgi:dTDP-4-amino-4,6-dideoxygalactose transaminase